MTADKPVPVDYDQLLGDILGAVKRARTQLSRRRQSH